jgi:hypothetical protein
MTVRRDRRLGSGGMYEYVLKNSRASFVGAFLAWKNSLGLGKNLCWFFNTYFLFHIWIYMVVKLFSARLMRLASGLITLGGLPPISWLAYPFSIRQSVHKWSNTRHLPFWTEASGNHVFMWWNNCAPLAATRDVQKISRIDIINHVFFCNNGTERYIHDIWSKEPMKT